MNEALARRWDQALSVSAVLAVLGAVLTIVWPPMFPCQDAPGHLTDIRVLQNPELFAEWLQVHFAPAAQGFRMPTALLAQIMSPIVAAKIVLTGYLFGLIWAFDGLARVRGAMRPLAWAAAAAVFVGWYYAMGFFNFLAALTIGSMGLRLWAEGEEHPRRRWIAAALFAICSLAHVVTGGMFLVQAWFSDVVARVPVRDVIRRGFLLVPAGLLSVVISLLALRAHAELGAVEQIGVLDLEFSVTLRDLFATALVSYSPVGYAAAALMLAGLGVAWVAEARAGLHDRQRRAARALGVAWVVAFLSLPMNALGWHFASPRTLFFAYVIPTALVAATPATRIWGTTLAALCAVVTLGGAPIATAEGTRIAHTVEDFGDVPSGLTFVVNYHPEALMAPAPWARANIGTGRYATWSGGVDPGLFANNPVRQSVLYARPMNELFPATDDLHAIVSATCRDDARCSSAEADVARADCVAATAVHWQSVALVEAPEPFVARLIARGFERVAPNLLVPNAATLRFGVTVDPLPDAGQLVAQLAYPGTCGVIQTVVVDVADLPDEHPTLQVAPLPAGPLTVTVFVDQNGNRIHDSGELLAVPTRQVVLAAGELLVESF